MNKIFVQDVKIVQLELLMDNVYANKVIIWTVIIFVKIALFLDVHLALLMEHVKIVVLGNN